MALEPYVVRQGDHLSGLAQRFGFVADDVWNDPKNADLKKKRTNPNILMPGDILYVPEVEKTWLPLATGSTNTFTADVPNVCLALRLMLDGSPASNVQYEVEGVNVPPGTTDGDGIAHLTVPVTTSRFQLRLVERDEVHEVRVGYLDPADEPSGAWGRLGCLGYFGRTGCDVSGEDDELAAALRGFQREHELEITGSLDDATVQKLTEVFGS